MDEEALLLVTLPGSGARIKDISVTPPDALSIGAGQAIGCAGASD